MLERRAAAVMTGPAPVANGCVAATYRGPGGIRDGRRGVTAALAGQISGIRKQPAIADGAPEENLAARFESSSPRLSNASVVPTRPCLDVARRRGSARRPIEH